MKESFTYTAFIIGGEGPDVWDKEIAFTACDIGDAVGIAQGHAEEMGGWVTDVGQTYEPLTAAKI